MDCYLTADGRYAALEGTEWVEIRPGKQDAAQCKRVDYSFADLVNIESAKQACLAQGNQWTPLPAPYGGKCEDGMAPLVSTPSSGGNVPTQRWLEIGGAIAAFLIVAGIVAAFMYNNDKTKFTRFVNGKSAPPLGRRKRSRK